MPVSTFEKIMLNLELYIAIPCKTTNYSPSNYTYIDAEGCLEVQGQGRRQDFQKGGSALSIESPQRGSRAVYTCTRVNMCILINSFAIASRGT